jgi:hypothetical protein
MPRQSFLAELTIASLLSAAPHQVGNVVGAIDNAFQLPEVTKPKCANGFEVVLDVGLAGAKRSAARRLFDARRRRRWRAEAETPGIVDKILRGGLARGRQSQNCHNQQIDAAVLSHWRHSFSLV